MPGFGHGLNRAVSSFLSGILTGLILNSFSHTGLFDENLASILIVFIGLVSVLDFMAKMKYWATTYILGFVFGYSFIAYIFGINIFMIIVLIFSVYIIARRILDV